MWRLTLSMTKCENAVCLGLGPKKHDEGTEIKIFSVVAETNRVTWTVRNRVLHSYEQKKIERIVILLEPMLGDKMLQ